MAAWPTLKEVRTLLRLQPDDTEDGVIQSALAAAIAYGIGRTNNQWAADATDLPDNAHEACLIDAARIYRRRDSLDGTIGWGDAGAIRVGRFDPEVDRLYALCPGSVVFG
jgi:Phage gp6-like head-tail connector protein